MILWIKSNNIICEKNVVTFVYICILRNKSQVLEHDTNLVCIWLLGYSMKIEAIFSQNKGFFLDTSREIHLDM